MRSYRFSRLLAAFPWLLVALLVADFNLNRAGPRTPTSSPTERILQQQQRHLQLQKLRPHAPSPLARPAAAAVAGAVPARAAAAWRLRPLSVPQPPPPPPAPPPLPIHAAAAAVLVSAEAQGTPAAVIYVVTPTYARPAQKAELTRLANTFRQVPWLHWVLVEDAPSQSPMVRALLARSGVPGATHLCAVTPRRYRRAGLPRASEQRNEALRWLRGEAARGPLPAVVYFADDDNTYSLELFHEMRDTRKVSVWPVGLVGGRRYERPVVRAGRVVAWYTGWRPDRPFATDMAGFAVNLQVLLENPFVQFRRRGGRPGMQESDFLRQITTMQELEPKARNCTKVLVWHTRTEKVNLANEPSGQGDSVEVEV
ncbi:galactosylgalactosylxylosylprotein 3-beta-glucuronosyltransferase 2-like [Lampetra fluviatilis]